MYLGLVCSTIGLFIVISFRFTITHMTNMQEINIKLLDHELVSIEDYSVKGEIDKDMYHMALQKTNP